MACSIVTKSDADLLDIASRIRSRTGSMPMLSRVIRHARRQIGIVVSLAANGHDIRSHAQEIGLAVAARRTGEVIEVPVRAE